MMKKLLFLVILSIILISCGGKPEVLINNDNVNQTIEINEAVEVNETTVEEATVENETAAENETVIDNETIEINETVVNISEEENLSEGIKEYIIGVYNHELDPESLIVKVGDTVTWVNKKEKRPYGMFILGVRKHRHISSDYLDPDEGEYNFSYTFNESDVGEMVYVENQDRLEGEIIVEE